MPDFNDNLRKKFWETHARVQEMFEDSAKEQKAFEDKRNELAEREKKELVPLRDKLLKKREGLYEAQNELAAYARALGGKTGEDPNLQKAARTQKGR